VQSNNNNNNNNIQFKACLGWSFATFTLSHRLSSKSFIPTTCIESLTSLGCPLQQLHPFLPEQQASLNHSNWGKLKRKVLTSTSPTDLTRAIIMCMKTETDFEMKFC
jgi:hypothetical protein